MGVDRQALLQEAQSLRVIEPIGNDGRVRFTPVFVSSIWRTLVGFAAENDNAEEATTEEISFMAVVTHTGTISERKAIRIASIVNAVMSIGLRALPPDLD